MKSKLYPDSICDISEKDFWSHIRVPEGCTHPALLQKAIRLGRSGRRAEGYRALGEYHRLAMGDVWAFHRDRALSGGLGHPRQKARDVLRLKITGWHATTVQFEGRIDWNCPAFGASGQCGFHYLGWLSPAIRRFIEKREQRYRDCLTDIVESYYGARNSLDWIAGQHPVYYELGANSKTRVLLPLYLALIQDGATRGRTIEAFMKLFLGFARSLQRLQKGYRGGNWQIVGSASLFCLSRMFPEFSEARRWERTGVKYLLEHLQKDFFSDGGHRERCWGYGFMSIGGMMRAYEMDQIRGGLGGHRAVFLRKIRRTFRWFARTLGPGELCPEYGDGALGSGSGYIDAALRYFPTGTGRDLGVDRGISYLLKPSGFAVMRNGVDKTYLNTTFGRFAGWHSHFDTFNVNLWAYGRPLIEEAGRFDSYDNPIDCMLRTEPFHNVVTIDGQHFVDHDRRDIVGRDVVWYSTPRVDYFSGWHDAYKRLPILSHTIDAVVRRTIVFVKDPGYALIFDSVTDPSGRRPGFVITQNWHSPAPFRVTGPDTVRTKGAPGVVLTFARSEHLRRLETGVDFAGDEVTAKGLYPDRYHLRARRWMPIGHLGSTGFATLLMPFGSAAPKVSIRPVADRGSVPFRVEAFEVRTPRGKDLLVLNPELLAGAAWKGRPLKVRARIELGAGRGKVTVP